jgi:hypothetical protein
MNFFFKDDFPQFLNEYFAKYTEQHTNEINYALIITSALFAVIIILIFLKLLSKKVNYKHYDPDSYPAKFKKISGFLFLLLAFLIFDLIKNFYHLYSYLFLFNSETYSFLAQIKISFLRNWWSIIIYFTIITAICNLIFSFFNLFYFVNRKRLFKFLMLCYIPLVVLEGGLKYFLVTQVLEPNHYIIYSLFNQWSDALYLSFIIFLYVLFSRRVNAALSK